MPWHNIFIDAVYRYRSEKNNLIPKNVQETHYAGLHFRMNIADKDFMF